MLKACITAALAASALPHLLAGTEERTISLAGDWRLRLDPGDAGIAGEWFKNEDQFSDGIHLPGSTDEQRFGKRNEKREAGRLTRAYEYAGPAWYQRRIVIPQTWQGKRISLFLERCHWETRAWLDAYSLGLKNSLSGPHIYEIRMVDNAGAKPVVTPGTHLLTIRVDNRLKIDIGESSGVTEQGPGNWNGIAGRMELRATDLVWVESVSVYPNLGNNSIHVKVKVRNSWIDRARTAS